MSEIEKMYENAGIEPYIYCSKPQLDCDARETGNCKQDCEYYSGERTHTTFTAEKQLEITKFLLKKAVYYDVKDDKYWFYYEECESAGYKPFDEAIAHFINKLWKDLSSEEKQQVKGILE